MIKIKKSEYSFLTLDEEKVKTVDDPADYPCINCSYFYLEHKKKDENGKYMNGLCKFKAPISNAKKANARFYPFVKISDTCSAHSRRSK